MASKRKVDFIDIRASKKRKAITMEVKVDIIRRSDQGISPTEIGKSLGLSRSTVATIIKDKDRILEHVKGSTPMKATVITKQRSGLIIEMERLLVLWLKDQNERQIPVSFMVIREKAKRLFEALKREKGKECESEVFVASRGWFMRFKERTNFRNIKVEGVSASTVEKVATEKNKDLTLKDLCKAYNILDAVDNIADSWDEVNQTSMNGVWDKLCPQFANDNTEAQESVTCDVNNDIDISKTIKVEIEEEEPEQSTSDAEESFAEDLVQPEKQMIKKEEEEEEDEPTPEPKRFTRQGLQEGFALIEEGLSRFKAEDPNMERYSRVARAVMDSLRCYKEILEDRTISRVTCSTSRS